MHCIRRHPADFAGPEILSASQFVWHFQERRVIRAFSVCTVIRALKGKGGAMPETRKTSGDLQPPSWRIVFGIREAVMQIETYFNSIDEGRRS